MRFPTVSGANLNRQIMTLPVDLQGDLNVVVIAFQQWQQSQVDTWIPSLERLERAHPGLAYYELPTIQQMNPLARLFINEGMRAGIPNEKARRRTVTLYLDKREFRRSLDLPHEDHIYVLLLNRQGDVLWRTSGVYSGDKGTDLTMAVRSARMQLRSRQALDEVLYQTV
ncbi:MAG: hypothetical protein R3300_10320 [Candidatus Promineifilaceae bacterium]|nr:hypothetical protein [Candidatus Promineifilaceae bacterium]